jgi:transcriptional regulatory protein LevR
MCRLLSVSVNSAVMIGQSNTGVICTRDTFVGLKEEKRRKNKGTKKKEKIIISDHGVNAAASVVIVVTNLIQFVLLILTADASYRVMTDTRR